MAAVRDRRSTMLLSLCYILWFSGVSLASSGHYIVTHAPSHVTFQEESQRLQTSDIADVISSSFGFQLNKDYHWNGLGQGNIFKRPKANVVISVEGMPSKGLNVNHIASYETDQNTMGLETESVTRHIHELSGDEQPLTLDFSIDTTVFDIRSEHPSLFSGVPSSVDKLRQLHSAGLLGFSPAQVGSLNATLEADLLFLGELHILQQIGHALKTNPEYTKSRMPDFYHFKLRALGTVLDSHGEGSVQAEDAIALLESVLESLTQDFKAIYDDNVVVQIVTLPKQERHEIHVRKSRSLLEDTAAPPSPTTAPKPAPNVNLAANYDEMYPIFFNIILWLSIILGLAIYGISYGIWFMDPGRDSIIYRMTSTRIKKD